MSAFHAPVLLVYVARRALGPFAVLTGVLLFALALERVLSLVQIVTDLGAPIYSVGELISYLLPHYLGIAIPAAWFLGILIGLRALQRDSELTVMRASGLPLWRIVTPLVVVSLVLALVMIGLTGYLQPYARHAYRARLQELKSRDFWSKVQPGVFTTVEGDANVVRVGTTDDNGRRFQDFFASYRPPGSNRRIFVSAREAHITQLAPSSSDTDTQLDLIEGMMLVRPETGSPQQQLQSVSFGEFPWKLSEAGLLPPYGPRGQDEREMTFGELLHGNAPAKPVNDSPARRHTEWHSRTVKCVSLLFLTILAAPLALLGRDRASRPYGFPIGVVLLVLYQKVLSMGEAYGKLGELPPGVGVWVPCAALAVVSLAAFYWLGGDRNAPAPHSAALTGSVTPPA